MSSGAPSGGGPRSTQDRGPLEVVLFGKEGCHLCDAVEAEIRALKEVGFALTVVDIDRNPASLARYLIRVPVVTVGGREVFEAKMMDRKGEWKARLQSLLRGR